jgi:hypothetical protein
VQRLVERRILDGEAAVGAFVDERRDPVTVHRPGSERPEDEEVQGPLDQRKRKGFRHSSLRRCGESGGWLDSGAPQLTVDSALTNPRIGSLQEPSESTTACFGQGHDAWLTGADARFLPGPAVHELRLTAADRSTS